MILDVIQVSKDLFSASFTIERENTQIRKAFIPPPMEAGGLLAKKR